MAGSDVIAPPGHFLSRLRPELATLRPTWSVPAAMRAVRATVVVPAMLAITDKVIGDPQMALFAVFGGFASLVLVTFGGTRRDRLIAHLELAVVGSIVLTIGTAVSGTAWLAALVTIPVVFGIFFAGVTGPNAASGATAALLAYVLPVASPGGVGTIPSRLEGWWLAAAASTIAVLLLSPRSPGDRLRAAAAASAAALSDHLAAAVRGEATQANLQAALAAKHKLIAVFAATPYRPTGLATADQAMASVVQALEWCTVLVTDAMDDHLDLSRAAPPDRDLLGATSGLLADMAALLSGRDAHPDLDGLERARAASTDHLRALSGDPDTVSVCARQAFHAQVIAIATRSAAADTLIATRRASSEIVAAQRRDWYGEQTSDPVTARVRLGTVSRAAPTRDPGDPSRDRPGLLSRRLPSRASGAPPGDAAGRQTGAAAVGNRRGVRSPDGPGPRLDALAGAAGVVTRHASFRSVWVRNSVRGAVGLALAVAVADLSGVQHGFWVVLGTLSVLRTNAASTGATALRALAGTVIGFVIGAALLLGIGTGPVALWVALPVAVLIAAYAPGTAPFAIGQAAFTVVVVVLFNLLVPAGWKVGLLRVQDVAIGCAVSLVVGLLFWPRGASGVVGDDLADSLRVGAAYLAQAVDWVLGLRDRAPDTSVAAVTAEARLDDALRGFLAEQGSKRVPKEELWRLVMAGMRLRMTAYSLASLRGRPAPGARDAHPHIDPEPARLRDLAAEMEGFYDRVAAQVGRPVRGDPPPVEIPPLPALDATALPGAALPGAAPTPTAAPPAVAPPAVAPPAGAASPAAAPAGTAPASAAPTGTASASAAPAGTASAAAASVGAGATPALAAPAAASPDAAHPHAHPYILWVREHLYHLHQHLDGMTAPALHVAELRRNPWWR